VEDDGDDGGVRTKPPPPERKRATGRSVLVQCENCWISMTTEMWRDCLDVKKRGNVHGFVKTI